jgi:hypothetical protein
MGKLECKMFLSQTSILFLIILKGCNEIDILADLGRDGAKVQNRFLLSDL